MGVATLDPSYGAFAGPTFVRVTSVAKRPQDAESVSGGWPAFLSNLKTLLETGHALPHTAAAK